MQVAAEGIGGDVLARGRYRVRLSRAGADIRAAQALRYRAFVDPAGGGLDADRFDGRCLHVLVEEAAGGALVACYRLLPLAGGGEIGASYSAQFYDLGRLAGWRGAMLEMGRFCVAAGRHDPEILRSAWAMATRVVDRLGVTFLFGCSSFAGTDPAAHRAGFAALGARHLAPAAWRPGRRAREVHVFAQDAADDAAGGGSLRAVPGLLRSYLALGGRVSDHAVIDRELGTMHVFTGLEVARVPAQRARRLRVAAWGSGGVDEAGALG